MDIRVLVTGAGSGVGQGIIKALRASTLPVVVISSDISAMNCALYRTDESVILPRVEAPGSLAEIIAKLKKFKVQVVMIGSEFDLSFFSQHKDEIESQTGCVIAVAPPETVKIAEDKWLTAAFLRENNLPFAPSVIAENVEQALELVKDWRYPFILKTRTGTSSRHVHVICTESDLREKFGVTPHPMLQQMISQPSQDLAHEYTCSVFKTRDGRVLGPFTARRTLRGGSSWIVEVDAFTEIFPLMKSIGEKLKFEGSLNVQLMVDKNKTPTPFEFNARFSGTTAVRAHFGFNEPEMFIKSYFLKDSVPEPVIRKGIAMRYLEEVFIEGASERDLVEPLPKGHVRPWF